MKNREERFVCSVCDNDDPCVLSMKDAVSDMPDVCPFGHNECEPGWRKQ